MQLLTIQSCVTLLMTMVVCAVSSLVLLLSVFIHVHSRPDGAPVEACSTLIPLHNTANNNVSNANDPPGGFYIYSDLFNNGNDGAYMADTDYEVTLATVEDRFHGFIIQAREAGSDTLIGTFTIQDSDTSKLLMCPGDDGKATVTHTNRNYKSELSFTWRSPSSSGTVDIRYSVVLDYDEDFYANMNTADFRPSCPFPPATVSDDNYAFEFGSSGDDYYLATRVNPNNEKYLDVVLEGVANGWVAVGFSENRQMEEDDVLGCRVDSDNMVIAVDTWNPSPRRAANVLDLNQTDICMHSASFSDGRIICRFSRLIEGGNSGQDYDLNANYYLLYGRRTAAQTITSLAFHGDPDPLISAETVNVSGSGCGSLVPNSLIFTIQLALVMMATIFLTR